LFEINVFLGDQVIVTRELGMGDLCLGRSSDNDLVLDGQEVSPQHARVQVNEKGLVTIEDRGSDGGLWLQDKRVRMSVWLPGHAVTIGPYTLNLRRLAPAASAQPGGTEKRPSPAAAATARTERPSGRKYFVIFILAGVAIAGAMAFMAYLDQEEKARESAVTTTQAAPNQPLRPDGDQGRSSSPGR
jgi:pSer/pThr/pTyr-binding forkhead associated (FHA) protein